MPELLKAVRMEHEITGHSLKAYKIAKNTSMSVWEKVKEIGIEVVIIVFAVSLAAYLERWKEHNHEQADAKEFLMGLKTDLQHDITEMQEDKVSYNMSGRAFRYISSLPVGDSLRVDSMRIYSKFINNSTGLIANSGRYEGFKSSGKIMTIENKELQNDIMDLYQENIPNLLLSTNYYTKRKELLWEFIAQHKIRDKNGTSNMRQVLEMDVVKNLGEGLSYTDEIIERYDSTISKSKRIVAQIDEKYGIESASH